MQMLMVAGGGVNLKNVIQLITFNKFVFDVKSL